jgi:hypothetical protein
MQQEPHTNECRISFRTCIATHIGMRDITRWWFLSMSPPQSTKPFIWRSHQLCTMTYFSQIKGSWF